jgi:hypothetical protein
MSDLRPCPECRRHVRIDESACPFCAAALAPAAPASLPVGRLTRAAVFTAGAALAAGAGCGGKTAPAQDPIDNTATAIDAGVDQQQDIDAGPVPPPPPPDHDVPMPYGAPPARERIV